MALEKYIKDTNRIINCADPGKDAATRENGRQILNVDPHGHFLRNNVIRPLFRGVIGNDMNERVWNRINGCGDSTIVEDNFKETKLGLVITNRIISITNSTSSEDLILSGCNFVEDNLSIVPKSSDYYINHPTHPRRDSKRIFTPADIFDSLSSGKPTNYFERNTPLYAIDTISTISDKDFDIFALSDVIKEITFWPRRPYYGNRADDDSEDWPRNDYRLQYRFIIRTTIQGYEERMFDFDSDFKPRSDIFAGNNTKNKFILHNYRDNTKLNDIKFRVLVKLLGDLLKVYYLKDLIKKGKLIKDKTYITTRDKNLQVRALLNNIQCILREGSNNNLYIKVYEFDDTPVEKRNKLIKYNKEIRDELLNMLKKQYKTTHDNILRFIILINKDIEFKVEADFRFTFLAAVYTLNLKLPPEAQKELQLRLEEMEKAINNKYEELKQKILSFPITNLDEIRNYVHNNQIFCPFIVQVDHTKKQGSLNGNPPEIGVVLPRIKIFRTHDDSNIIEFIKKYIFYFPPPVPETYTGPIEPRPFKFPEGGGSSGKMNTSPEKPDAKSDIGHYLKANKEHGFFAFFVITYLPNVLLTSYAYAMTTDIDYKKFNRFFGKDTIRMCEIFGKPYDYVFDSYGEGRKEDDELMRELCSIGSAAYKQRGDFSIFDYADNDTREFFTIIDGKHAFKEYANSLAKDTYQALYYAEVSRVILNQPSNGDPLKVEGSESQMNVITPTKLSKSASKSKKSASKSKKSRSKTKTLKSKLTQYIRPVAKRTKSAWSRKPVLKTIVPRTQTRKIVA
jgi:hypothetical protein